MQTVEDTIEILAGTRQRIVNIRLDVTDSKIIKSLGRQLSRNVALTDRQLDLSLKKIGKYRLGLEKCGVDVDKILNLKPLKWPIREIDRSQNIYLEQDATTKKSIINVKYVFSKKFAEIWADIEDTVTMCSNAEKNIKKVTYTEKNLYTVVEKLAPLQFNIADDILEIYEEIERILKKPENYVPHLDFQDGVVSINNVNHRCKAFLDERFKTCTDDNLLEYIDNAKIAGISIKTQKLLKKVKEISPNEIVTLVCSEGATRYRLNPEEHSFAELLTAINTLNQWPLVVVIEETNSIFETVKHMIEELSKFVPINKMNVFFRLKNEQMGHQQFNQFVKDNHLNNYIDSTTKVVFISRNKIPKPLIKADWQPRTAIITSNHDFGKLSAYLNDFSTVYYYNNSVAMRNSRLKGADKIVQL
jgi:hypothetical protein